MSGVSGTARRGPSVGTVRRTAVIMDSRGRRRRRMLLRVLGALLLVGALFSAYNFWFKDSSFVEIKELEIRGLTAGGPGTDEVKQAIIQAAGDMTTLNVRSEVLEQVLAKFPRVAGVEISTAFPSSATVTVRERSNGSILGSGSGALLIASDGTVLGPADDAKGYLPRLGVSKQPQGGALEGAAREQAVVLGAVPGKLRPYVAGSRWGEHGVAVELSDGTELYFGDASQAALKWRAAASVLADPELGTVDYVDLTVARRPAVGGGASESASVEELVAPSY